MARTEEIRIKVRDYILREFLDGEDDSRLTDDTPLITGGIMDSIGTVRLVTHLEHEFQIVLEQRDIVVQHFDTVHGVANLVERKLAGS
jgi:acyl carrier protein